MMESLGKGRVVHKNRKPLTCHKTQGGQWSSVFIDSSLNQKETLEVEDLRWLYTALTRAQERVYFVNFKEEFFEE